MRNTDTYRVTPTILPGMFLLCLSETLKKAACGPPKKSGTPKRCEFPKATSHPSSPGEVNKVNAIRSVAQATTV